jgi:acetyl-CoA carboxylase alpha subunit
LQSPGENPTDAAKCLDGELLGCFAAIGKDFGNCRATEELRRIPLRRCCAPEAQGYEGEHSTKFRKRHPEGAPRHAARGKISAPLDCVNLILWGAYPGVGAEERYISESIAVNLSKTLLLRTPIVAAVIGEGGSGGALGIGVADRVLMLENAYYSVISPEGCAAILWKYRSDAPEAMEALKLTAVHLKELELIGEVIPEPLGAHARTMNRPRRICAPRFSSISIS